MTKAETRNLTRAINKTTPSHGISVTWSSVNQAWLVIWGDSALLRVINEPGELRDTILSDLDLGKHIGEVWS